MEAGTTGDEDSCGVPIAGVQRITEDLTEAGDGWFKTTTRASIFSSMAAQAGVSRMVAGIHFQSDIDAGAARGHNVAGAVIDWARTDGSDE